MKLKKIFLFAGAMLGLVTLASCGFMVQPEATPNQNQVVKDNLSETQKRLKQELLSSKTDDEAIDVIGNYNVEDVSYLLLNDEEVQNAVSNNDTLSKQFTKILESLVKIANEAEKANAQEKNYVIFSCTYIQGVNKAGSTENTNSTGSNISEGSVVGQNSGSSGFVVSGASNCVISNFYTGNTSNISDSVNPDFKDSLEGFKAILDDDIANGTNNTEGKSYVKVLYTKETLGSNVENWKKYYTGEGFYYNCTVFDDSIGFFGNQYDYSWERVYLQSAKNIGTGTSEGSSTTTPTTEQELNNTPIENKIVDVYNAVAEIVGKDGLSIMSVEDKENCTIIFKKEFDDKFTLKEMLDRTKINSSVLSASFVDVFYRQR